MEWDGREKYVNPNNLAEAIQEVVDDHAVPSDVSEILGPFSPRRRCWSWRSGLRARWPVCCRRRMPDNLFNTDVLSHSRMKLS